MTDPAATEIFRRFAEEVRRCGPVAIVPDRARIAFHTRTRFATVSLGRGWVDADLVFARRPRSARFLRIETFSPGNHVGALRLRSPQHVDDQVGRWIERAYLVGLQRHVRQDDPPPIRSRRLDLVPMSPELMVALLRGEWAAAGRLAGAPIPTEWTGDGWSWLRIRLAQYADDPSVLPWLARLMVRRGRQREIVGNAGFHGPPDQRGRAELGYQVVNGRRRRGFAAETVQALMGWASAEHGVRRFRASVGPWNDPSLGLVRKLGFAQTGVQWDEQDGEELVFELEVPPLNRGVVRPRQAPDRGSRS